MLRTVLIGCGAISSKHIAAIARLRDQFDLVGVFDIDQERAEQAAKDAADAGAGDDPKAFTDMQHMAAALEPDVAAIATPSTLHAEQASYWMERGAHLVLEKPVALSSRDIEALLAMQQECGVRVAVGYVLRYSAHIRLVERAIREGRFGKIFHASLSLYWNRNNDYYRAAPWRGTWASDGGSLMNQATHGIDLLQAFLPGEPRSIYGELGRFMRPIEADDFAAATVRFDSGAIATLHATVDTYPNNHGARITILGETGTVELSGNSPTTITAWKFPSDSAWEEIDQQVAQGVYSGAGERDGHAGVYQELSDAIEDGREPLTGLQQSSVSAQMVLGILGSHKHQAPVDFPVEFSTSEMVGVQFD